MWNIYSHVCWPSQQGKTTKPWLTLLHYCVCTFGTVPRWVACISTPAICWGKPAFENLLGLHLFYKEGMCLSLFCVARSWLLHAAWGAAWCLSEITSWSQEFSLICTSLGCISGETQGRVVLEGSWATSQPLGFVCCVHLGKGVSPRYYSDLHNQGL